MMVSSIFIPKCRPRVLKPGEDLVAGLKLRHRYRAAVGSYELDGLGVLEDGGDLLTVGLRLDVEQWPALDLYPADGRLSGIAILIDDQRRVAAGQL